jgi:hypothetical protein
MGEIMEAGEKTAERHRKRPRMSAFFLHFYICANAGRHG